MALVITKEMIEAAEDYMPLATKTALTRNQAESIVKPAGKRNGIKQDDMTAAVSLPPRYVADEEMRTMMEMSIFMAMYMKVLEPDENGTVTIDRDLYEEFASSHIFGQINLMANGTFGRDNPELKTKIKNMLADYNDYQKRLTAEIRNLLGIYNDTSDRMMLIMSGQVSPEYIQNLLKQMDISEKMLADYKAERNADA